MNVGGTGREGGFGGLGLGLGLGAGIFWLGLFGNSLIERSLNAKGVFGSN